MRTPELIPLPGARMMKHEENAAKDTAPKAIIIFEAPLSRATAEALQCDWIYARPDSDQPRATLASSTPIEVDLTEHEIHLPNTNGDNAGIWRPERVYKFRINREEKEDGESLLLEFRAHFTGSEERMADLYDFWRRCAGDEIDIALRSLQMELKAKDDAEREAAAGPTLVSAGEMDRLEGKAKKKRQKSRGEQSSIEGITNDEMAQATRDIIGQASASGEIQ